MLRAWTGKEYLAIHCYVLYIYVFLCAYINLILSFVKATAILALYPYRIAKKFLLVW